ncbi:MMPL domain protein [Xylanimonas cellulosilytica DSM 15894]|uniref:MMPL domain protein n=1 Tax=Xylanimonas cellulosilytica (strain DSM 15894 / JCM 12276 / CECT 5975 / KCTC 9989 / LMG 20990 / NBRC 107835 / XIL07) TaxID=446471 RepID=D1BX73_XYLCX|nr:MMPL family transporter [Xylanimonas cellulosilytica]ACZ31641.1 MMPL domain protein [Xylanimonas cellulosilytica DSM 15894]
MSALPRWITHRSAKWIVVAVWLAAAALLSPLAGVLSEHQSNDAKAWLPPAAESTQVMDRAQKFGEQDVLTAVVGYVREGGVTAADLAQATADAAAFADLDTVDGEVVGPVPSQDGQALQVVIPFMLGDGGWDAAPEAVDAVRAITGDGSAGLDVVITGPAAGAADSAEAFSGIESTLLYAAATVVVVILLLTYRSPVLWVLPLVSAGVALVVSQAVIAWLAREGVLEVNAQSQGILTVLVFGAGTDYALLLVARYREELRRHADRHEAMAVALHRAAPAIVASGATVAAGMLCLMLAQLASTSGLGPVAAIGVVVAVAVMLTLLPALLVVCGRWVFWPRVPGLGQPEPTADGAWARLGARIAKAPRRTWVTTTLVLAAMSVGVVQLSATGLTAEEAFRGERPSIAGAAVLAEHFPAGAGEPVVVVAAEDSIGDVATALRGVDGIDPASVTEPVAVDGDAVVQATLLDAADSDAAQATVERVRDAVHAVPGADAQVGGSTATTVDVLAAASADNRVVMPAILVAVLIILALLLRSIVAPVLLVGTVVLSFGAALGLSALVFRHVFDFAGADPSMPLFAFVFLVALGIDYNIFLMSRVREESLLHGTRRGALTGLAATGGVITSAGLVLAGTFAALATLPVVSFAEIGFTVAFGVLLDTIVVRSVLVTALNLDVGDRMWWPSRLARRRSPGLTNELVSVSSTE